MIANCSHDERGKLSGGAAGDQTGNASASKGEWRLCPWYNRPWLYVIRFEDEVIANGIAKEGEAAARNDCIGYDQSQRMTYWHELEKNGYKSANIKKRCETDCSAGTLAIVKAVGFQLRDINNADKPDFFPTLKAIEALCKINPSGYSGNARAILVKAGGKVLTAKKYLTSDKWLKPGDIMINPGHHVAINLSWGSEAKKAETAKKAAPSKKSTQKADVTKIARQVIDGKWGNGASRRKALEAAGYNYKEIQAEVNRILKGGK